MRTKALPLTAEGWPVGAPQFATNTYDDKKVHTYIKADSLPQPLHRRHPVEPVFLEPKPWRRGSHHWTGGFREGKDDDRMTAGTLAGLTTRAALVLGFGLTLGLRLFAGYDCTRHMAEVQTEAATINQRYMHAQELLSTVRVQVLLRAVYVRGPARGPASASECQDLRNALRQDGGLQTDENSANESRDDPRKSGRIFPGRRLNP